MKHVGRTTVALAVTLLFGIAGVGGCAAGGATALLGVARACSAAARARLRFIGVAFFGAIIGRPAEMLTRTCIYIYIYIYISHIYIY